MRVAGLEPARAYAQQILMVRSTSAALVGYHWASRLWCLPIPPYPHKSDFFISEGVTNLRRVRVHHTHNSPAIFESLLRESDNCLYRGGTPHYAGFVSTAARRHFGDLGCYAPPGLSMTQRYVTLTNTYQNPEQRRSAQLP